MEIIPIELFGIQVDVPFPKPLGLKHGALEEYAAALCDPKSGLALRPDQIRLKRWDDLFGYELSGHFFGENGTLTRTADRVKVAVRNGRTANDWNLIHHTLAQFYKLSQFEPKTVTTLSAHVHARFPSGDERDAWLSQFSTNALLSKVGALGYVQIPDWEKDIRILIEHSNVIADSIFIAWDTQFVNGQEWDSFLGSLPTVLENSANFFDLGLEPFREQV